MNLTQILASGSIQAVYQPILQLSDGSLFAHEALARGPEGPLHTPAALFRAAAEEGLVFALEFACRAAALRQKPPGALCLNVDPLSLQDPAFTRGMTAQVLSALGVAPSEVIFEITERIAIADYQLFRRTLDHYRSQGYRIALDDVGAGYSNLRLVAEAQPEFLKIDQGLVRGLFGAKPRRAAVSALVRMAEECDATAIAEGIENEEDLAVLRDLGVPLGQGFLLGRPAPVLLTLSQSQS
ncbi:MAG: EAL domain-containing protein [Thermaerobacter sp.]|nr:EAL domain-containing protein [Thermaerobacter sp.]